LYSSDVWTPAARFLIVMIAQMTMAIMYRAIVSVIPELLN